MHASRWTRGSGILALCAALLASTSGCGLLFTNGPPVGHEQMVGFSCTESETGPVLDVVVTALSVVGALAAASQSKSDFYDGGPSQGAAIATNLGWGLLSGISAGVGIQRTKACREAKMAMYTRLQQGFTIREGGATARGDTLTQAVQVTPAADTLRVGQQRRLVAVAYLLTGARLPSKRFRWSSSNDAIASVSNAGVVTAHAEGKVIVAANADNVVGTAWVVVVP